MNCLEFRRLLLTEPAAQRTECREHLRECPKCERFANQMESFEQQLAQALAVDVPPDMASKIRLERTIRDDQQRRSRSWWIYATAAGIVLLLGTSGFLAYHHQEIASATRAFQRAALEHIYMEPNALQVNENLEPARVDGVLAPFGGRMKADFGNVRFAGNCVVQNRLGAHIVVSGVSGPVTLLYLPNIKTRNRASFSDRRFDAIVVKAGSGSFAVVGEQGEPLQKTVHRVERHLSWEL